VSATARKAFFLKKEAKTFALGRTRCTGARTMNIKSFLVLFFQKRTAFFAV
jgi:hypothetical protein